MCKLLAIAAIALSLAGTLSAMSAQTVHNHEWQTQSRPSSTPSGGGQERPYL